MGKKTNYFVDYYYAACKLLICDIESNKNGETM